MCSIRLATSPIPTQITKIGPYGERLGRKSLEDMTRGEGKSGEGKKGGGMDPPPAELWRLMVILAVGVVALLQFDNPGVGLTGDLCENQKVVAAEAVRRLPLPGGLAVDPGVERR